MGMSYGNVGGYYDHCGCDYEQKGNGFSFVLLVVLFILLIIVGAHFIGHDGGYEC